MAECTEGGHCGCRVQDDDLHVRVTEVTSTYQVRSIADYNVLGTDRIQRTKVDTALQFYIGGTVSRFIFSIIYRNSSS